MGTGLPDAEAWHVSCLAERKGATSEAGRGCRGAAVCRLRSGSGGRTADANGCPAVVAQGSLADAAVVQCRAAGWAALREGKLKTCINT